MERQVIDNGKWFDKEAATMWKETTWWNGSNRISKATGTQFNHEELYRTANETWILHGWSQWQGSKDHWTEISAEQAAAWLLRNEHFEDVPETAMKAAEI